MMLKVGVGFTFVFLLVYLKLILFAAGLPSLAVTERDMELLEKQPGRWCRICKVIRMPGTLHCNECETCMVEYDHHCPWVSKCVTKGNMGTFSTFIVMGFCLLAFYGITIGFCVIFMEANE